MSGGVLVIPAVATCMKLSEVVRGDTAKISAWVPTSNESLTVSISVGAGVKGEGPAYTCVRLP